ncbi:iron ABC transporter substrate-binding protein [Corynebacterium phocae]|uniref:Iron ABC transporter substrate-binding protein n=1 Tax=Corynebacterium phocae TaxID=161895 RepID=A0A1L7D170_9CORY|nr:metal ABC transporter substrate-binding protein [Corynebacterium phocae]APT91844.1 iron ABC transporter substrate-binding protein [Corynebacterium phocae]KAA8727453.1 zinc ABC transporter substrate-binding protein [Corynebacterium phocae]
MRYPLIAAATAAALVLTGCGASDDTAEHKEVDGNVDGQLTVFATTGYIADAVKNIAPSAEVITMVGPGGDPHTYQPTTKDIETMKDADLVIWNGLHLEAQMIEQLESFGDKQLSVGDNLDEGDLLPWPEQGPEGEKLYDPHVWNSPELWTDVVEQIGDKMGEVDEANADAYEKAADAYAEKIETAVDEAQEILADAEPRILITGHDAFNYFGRTFGFEVFATDFVTTDAKLSPTQISELADMIAEKKVPSIFQDNQANPQAITALKEAVQDRGWDVKVSDAELFADTLGAESPMDTYLGALRHNAETVAKALAK